MAAKRERTLIPMAKPPPPPTRFNQPKPAATTAASANPPRQVANAPAQRPATVPSSPPANAMPRPAAKMELKPHTSQPSPQAIAEAAYFLWLQRGGNPTVNWLEAEAQLKSQPAR